MNTSYSTNAISTRLRVVAKDLAPDQSWFPFVGPDTEFWLAIFPSLKPLKWMTSACVIGLRFYDAELPMSKTAARAQRKRSRYALYLKYSDYIELQVDYLQAQSTEQAAKRTPSVIISRAATPRLLDAFLASYELFVHEKLIAYAELVADQEQYFSLRPFPSGPSNERSCAMVMLNGIPVGIGRTGAAELVWQSLIKDPSRAAQPSGAFSGEAAKTWIELGFNVRKETESEET